jgi:hypothetical protein
MDFIKIHLKELPIAFLSLAKAAQIVSGAISFAFGRHLPIALFHAINLTHFLIICQVFLKFRLQPGFQFRQLHHFEPSVISNLLRACPDGMSKIKDAA